VFLNESFSPNVILKEDNIELTLTNNLKRRGLPIK
jgi:hypothetical protein